MLGQSILGDENKDLEISFCTETGTFALTCVGILSTVTKIAQAYDWLKNIQIRKSQTFFKNKKTDA